MRPHRVSSRAIVLPAKRNATIADKMPRRTRRQLRLIRQIGRHNERSGRGNGVRANSNRGHRPIRIKTSRMLLTVSRRNKPIIGPPVRLARTGISISLSRVNRRRDRIRAHADRAGKLNGLTSPLAISNRKTINRNTHVLRNQSHRNRKTSAPAKIGQAVTQSRARSAITPSSRGNVPRNASALRKPGPILSSRNRRVRMTKTANTRARRKSLTKLSRLPNQGLQQA
jgi:hypothetical protein